MERTLRKLVYQPSMLHLGLGFTTSATQVMPTPFLPIIETTTEIHSPNNPTPATSWSQRGVLVDITFITSALHLQNKLSDFIGTTLRTGQTDTPFLTLSQFPIQPTTAVYLLITISVTRAIRQIAQTPILRPRNQPPHITPQSFFDGFGDSYITAYEAGGLLVGLIEVSPKANETVQDVRALAQPVIDSGDSPQQAFENAVEAMSNDRSSSVVVGSVGGTVPHGTMTPLDFVRLARDFPLQIQEIPSMYGNDPTNGTIQPTTESSGQNGSARVAIVPIYAHLRSYNDLAQFLRDPLPFSTSSRSLLRDLESMYTQVRRFKAEVTSILNARQSVTAIPVALLNELDGIRSELRSRELLVVEAIFQFSRVAKEERDNVFNSVAQLPSVEPWITRAREIASAQS